LRPLSFGELVDRSITLGLRGFLGLSVFAVPYTFVGVAEGLLIPQPWGTLQVVALVILAELIHVMFWAASCSYLAQLIGYGRASRLRACRMVARKLGGIISLTLLEAVVIVPAAIATAVPTLELAIFDRELSRPHKTYVGDVLVLATETSWIASVVFLCIAVRCVGLIATLSHVLEGYSLPAAIRSAVERVLKPKMRFRFIFVSALCVVPLFGATVMADAIIETVGDVPNVQFFLPLVTALIAFLSVTLMAAFDTLFYYDVRVRVEALDLQAAAATLRSDTSGA
jgi:hypothetical protein